MTQLVQALVLGLLIGGVYALMASGLTLISASGGRRSTAVSAVMSLAVLAGGSASCSWLAPSTYPESASTRM